MGVTSRRRLREAAAGTLDIMTPADVVIRPATHDDLPAVNRIYNRYVVDSHVSFDVEPWADAERVVWFDDLLADGHLVLVAVRGDAIVGAAWSAPWRAKAAYARSAETTVVLDPSEHGLGTGRLLSEELIRSLGGSGFHRCYAVIALPNEPSVRLHHKLGFTEIGVLDEVGHKNGRYISTMLMERKLTDDPPTSGER